MVKMRIGIYSMIIISTAVVASIMKAGNFQLFGIIFTAAFFVFINKAYSKIAIGITLEDNEVIFETVCGKRIRAKQEDIVSIRKNRVTDHETGSFTFNVKGIGAVMAGIVFTEPIIMKERETYEEIRFSDFPYAEFINFDD